MSAARASILALLLCWAFAAFADVAVPPLTGRVVDQTGTLSAADIAGLTETLKGLERRKGSQVAVLIVPTTEPETIEQYSIRVAEAWKIGRKKIDDGALLVVAKNDRKLRIEVGYGLEGALTDVTSRRIIDEIITPKFRSGDFAGGIAAGIDRMIGVIDGEPLPAPAPRPQRQSDDFNLTHFLDSFNPFPLIIALILGGVLRSVLGRLFGSIATGGMIGIVTWFMFGSLILSGVAGVIALVFTMFSDSISAATPRGRGGGAWSTGSSGSSWSGSSGGGSSSSDSGGFSGGGGDFGGGGASGSW
jgi:uncharacterized protein